MQKYFDETMRTPSSVMAYLSNPCVRTILQVRLVWCLIGIRKGKSEVTIETRARKYQLELMGALKVLIAKGRFCDIVGKKKGRTLLCEVRSGSYPHSGAKEMCEDNNQAEVYET